MYATAHALNMPERSIATVEDPVEYAIDGIKQLQVDELSGFTFPTALRLIRHSDPEVILVDEIRDPETATIGTDAAIAGNLVVAAMHAPSAAAVPVRLLDMGVGPYLVAAGLTLRRGAAPRAHAVPALRGRGQPQPPAAAEAGVLGGGASSTRP